MSLLAFVLVVALGTACASAVSFDNAAEELAIVGPVSAPEAEPTSRPTTAPTPTALPEPTPTPEPQPTGAAPPIELTEMPLRELSEDAAEYAASLHAPVGIAVVIPGESTVYTANGDELFHMASVVKVPIMLTVMNSAIQEDRALTDYEIRLMESMITLSDNDAATALWHDVGGAVAVETFLNSAGAGAIEMNSDHWGASFASAQEVASLLARLIGGEILEEASRALAMDLMSGVDPFQRWGITSGLDEREPVEATVGVKNGWYPAYDGWWVNSVGFVLPSDDRPAYTIAILSDQWLTLDFGVQTIEVIAQMINAELTGVEVAVSLAR